MSQVSLLVRNNMRARDLGPLMEFHKSMMGIDR